MQVEIQRIIDEKNQQNARGPGPGQGQGHHHEDLSNAIKMKVPPEGLKGLAGRFNVKNKII
jgi:hypothetical protein